MNRNPKGDPQRGRPHHITVDLGRDVHEILKRITATAGTLPTGGVVLTKADVVRAAIILLGATLDIHTKPLRKDHGTETPFGTGG